MTAAIIKRPRTANRPPPVRQLMAARIVPDGAPVAALPDPDTQGKAPMPPAQWPDIGRAPATHRKRALRLSAWALLRPESGRSALANAGQLGGSQMGVRLLAPVSAALPPIWLSMRASTAPDLRRDAEIALGVSIQPGGRLPFELVLEERIPIGSGEKSRPAAILIGGISDYPLDHGFTLEGYGQAGLVGARSPDLFADGRLTLSRGLAGPVRAGMGVWGAIQPHVGRVDIGPVINLPTKDLRLTVEWRFRIAGDARPASGPSVTLGKDF